MSYEEIILVDHINLEDEQCDVYIHTKDRRVLGLTDVCSNAIISYNVVYIDHYALGMRFTFALPMSEFSHLEYITKSRTPENVIADDFNSEKVFDDINSFIDDQVEDFSKGNITMRHSDDTLTDPPERLREP